MGNPIRIAFCNRHDCLIRKGGDTIQMLKTKEYLERDHGVRVDIVLDPSSDLLEKADIIHIFNLRRTEIGVPFVLRGKALEKKVILSTIFWDVSHAEYVVKLSQLHIHTPGFLAYHAKPIYDLAIKLWCKCCATPRLSVVRDIKKYREILSKVDLILPNSLEELECLKSELKLDVPSYRIVVNAVDTDVFCNLKHQPIKRKSVICIGRIEPVKNQIKVLKSLWYQPDIEITFVGAVANKRYYNRLKKLAAQRGKVQVIPDNLSQHKVAKLMAEHRVHVLASFRESPGLSTLESMATGCNVVVSDNRFCPINTYFRGLIGRSVFLCNPYSSVSIRRAVLAACSESINDSVSKYINDKYSWRRAANQTMSAYKSIM